VTFQMWQEGLKQANQHFTEDAQQPTVDWMKGEA
jgi:hypothetical protein